MLEITTNKAKNQKKLLMDGYTYMVRRPGAGESLNLSQFGKEVQKYEKRQDDLSESEQSVLTDKSMQSLKIVLSFFDSLGDEQAQDHLNSIDPEELMSVIKQVFEDKSES